MPRRFLVLFTLVFTACPMAMASLAEAIAARPGEIIEVPAGRHLIDAPLLFTVDGGGLYGPGTIVQTDPSQPIVRVDHAAGVRIEGVTLTRPEGARETPESAIRADHARDLVIRRVRIVDNHSQAGAITLRDCERTTLTDCDIINYKTIGIDDRTTSPLFGYAFHCIDGTGIFVTRSIHTTIANNRIIEERLLPTEASKDEHSLGSVTDGAEPLNLGELGSRVVRDGYVDNWHQGSAIVVTGPTQSRHTIIQGNLIVNSAQGIDLHSDYANVSGNVIDRCMIGIKAMHGSYGVVVSGNTITGADLWGMVFGPGTASHGTEPAEEGGEPREWNGDAGLIIANNLIADYGNGNEYWNWGGRREDGAGGYAIAFLAGQLDTNPPYTDILLTGNMVLTGGRTQDPLMPPKYRYALYLEGWDGDTRTNPTAAKDIRVESNTFHPGLRGISNAKFGE